MMVMFAKLTLITLVVLLSACSSVPTQHRDEAYYAAPNRSNQAEDLFASQGDISNQEIENILNYRLQLPAVNRIAILHLSHNPYWQFYSHDFAQISEEITTGFIDTLRSSQRVYDASY
jgi:hypothetical protein